MSVKIEIPLLTVILVDKDQVAVGFNEQFPYLESDEVKKAVKELVDLIYLGISAQILSQDIDSLMRSPEKIEELAQELGENVVPMKKKPK